MLTKIDIEKYLGEMNRRLTLENKFGEIIIAGGASLTMVYGARDSTHDIDALFSPADALRKIANEIANEYNLEEDWINDGVKGFLTDKMNTVMYKKYSNLNVSTIDAEGLLALKLTSARVYTKDMDDSITLMKHLNIKNEQQLFEIIETYTSKNQQTPNCYYFTQEAFTKYKKEIKKEKDYICETTRKSHPRDSMSR